MAYQRGSLKKVRKKRGWIWVLRYRINGAEQTPIVVGLVANFPSEDEALLRQIVLDSGSGSTAAFHQENE